MANVTMSHGEVKSICNSLEVSPSSHASDSHYGGPASISVHKSGKANAKGAKPTHKMTPLSGGGKSGKPAGYKRGFGTVEQV